MTSGAFQGSLIELSGEGAHNSQENIRDEWELEGNQG